MSLQGLRKIDDHAVTFSSHLDGARFELTPERSIEIQDMLDSTITMVLDQCVPADSPENAVVTAMERSLCWAERSRAGFQAAGWLWPVRHRAGRHGSVASPALGGRPGRDGFRWLRDRRPRGRRAPGRHVRNPRRDHSPPPEPLPALSHGVGKPSDIVGAVARGIDMFDCVLPTRSGRTAQAWTRTGFLNLRNSRHAEDTSPIDPTCACETCRSHSRAYLHHLTKAKEILGSILLTWHNVHHYQTLMLEMREAIRSHRFADFQASFHADQGRPATIA